MIPYFFRFPSTSFFVSSDVQYGFADVLTYINSGNILFSGDEADIQTLKNNCETMISQRFSLDISVAILPAQALADALAHAPAWWNMDKDAKHNAIFVLPPATAAEVCAQVGEAKPEYESVAFHGQIVFWSAPIKTFSQTRWAKVVGSTAYGSITIRNANTTLKLAHLAQG